MKLPWKRSAHHVLQQGADARVMRLHSRKDLAQESQASSAGVSPEPLPGATPTHKLTGSVLKIASSQEISTVATLKTVRYHACLNGELSLSQSLASKVAVLAMDESKKQVALLITPLTAQDVIEAVMQQLHQRGITLIDSDQQAWICTPQIVMQVVNYAGAGGSNETLARQAARSAHWENFRSIVQWAFDHKASDIDFVLATKESVSSVYFLIDNKYITLPRWAMPTQTLKDMLGVAWQESKGGASPELEIRTELQAALDLELNNATKVRLRMSNMPTERGATMTFRLQLLGAARQVLTLEQAGYLPSQIAIFERSLMSKGGLTTLAGTVGSGKTVTLAILMALLHEMRPALKGVSIEDPVEIISDWMHQRTITRDLHGDNNADFLAAAATLFRSSFGVLLLGEIRDTLTGSLARAVAGSGHSVYASIHSPSAAGTISRCASPQIGIPLDTLAEPGFLRLNVYQALLLKNCPHCGQGWAEHASTLGSSIPQEKFERMLSAVEQLYKLPREALRFRNRSGCDHCRTAGLPELNGYAGRTACAEMLEVDDTMCELIKGSEMVALQRYWRGLSDGDITSADTNGKTALEVALYKAQLGQIDLHEIEASFESFTTQLARKEAEKALAARKNSARSSLSGPFGAGSTGAGFARPPAAHGASGALGTQAISPSQPIGPITTSKDASKGALA